MRPRAHVPLALTVGLLTCTPEYGTSLSALKMGDTSHPEARRVNATAALSSICGEPLDHGHDGGEIERQPYLQQVSATSARVLFTATSLVRPSVLVTGEDHAPVFEGDVELDESGAPDDGAQYKVRIDGLEPDSTYCYWLRDEGGTLYGPAGFRTARETGPARFAVWGDSGDGSDSQYTLAEEIASVPLELMLHVGDIAYEEGTLEQFEDNYFRVYEPLLPHFAMFAVPGNHEYKTAGAAGYHEVFDLPNTETYYSFNWGDVHFVGLDTTQLNDFQLRWLQADLSRTDKPWRIAFMHHSPYSSGKAHGSDGDVRRKLEPIFQKAGVQLVFSGHDHHYERSIEIDGIHYIVTGGGGGDTAGVGESWFTAFAQTVVHFVYIEVDGDTLSTHAIDATGEEFDQLVLKL